MKHVKKLLSLTALLASFGLAQVNDNGADARWRMKYGRSMPAIEQAREAAAAEQCDCGMPGCPHAKHAQAYSASARTEAEERVGMKTGRYPVQETAEAQVLAGNARRTEAEERTGMKTGRYPAAERELSASADPIQCYRTGCCKPPASLKAQASLR